MKPYLIEVVFELQIILEKVRIFVREMSKGGPAANDSSNAANSEKAVAKPKIDLNAAQPVKQEAKPKAVSKQHTGGKRKFESTEKFYASAKDIYACFTDAKCISAYTQSPAKVSQKFSYLRVIHILNQHKNVVCITASSHYINLLDEWF